MNKAAIEKALNDNKPYGRNWEDFLLPDQMEFLYKAFEQYAEYKAKTGRDIFNTLISIANNERLLADAVDDPILMQMHLESQRAAQRIARIIYAAPPPASEGEILQDEINKCNEALMQPNFSIDNYRCYWEGRKALAEELLATLPTREPEAKKCSSEMGLCRICGGDQCDSDSHK